MKNATNTLRAVIYLRFLGFDPENIRRALPKLTGISQADLARRLGTSRQNIGHHLSGIRQTPEIVQGIAEAYQVPPRELFADLPEEGGHRG